MTVALMVLVLAGLVLLGMIPAYVLGKRSGVSHPWLAFVPLVGTPVVALRAAGQSAWLVLLALIPSIGGIVVIAIVAVSLPPRHRRTRWWTLAFIVPFVNVVAYWAYAFSLPRPVAPPPPPQLQLDVAS